MERSVSLRPKFSRLATLDSVTAPNFLDQTGAKVILGEQVHPLGVVSSVLPDPSSLFGPRGAAVMADGSLWVCDTGHHRLLGWSRCPDRDGEAADWLIGQPDFFREGRNGHGDVTAMSVNVPTGITALGNGMAIADAWNHRVLIWLRTPRESHCPADLVLGQADFSGHEINRGSTLPDAHTLYWPYGVHWDGSRLYVADTGNRRVLWWEGVPQYNGQPADGVLGQRDFRCRDENSGQDPSAMSMRWPHAIVRWGCALAVSDAGDNRVLIWENAPQEIAQPASWILGQPTASTTAHNQGEYYPTASTFNMPYGITVFGDDLVVADTANSRLLAWGKEDVADGSEARALAGQPHFAAKGDNRWGSAQRDTLCWPYAVSGNGTNLLIADSGNNRVLLWELKR